MSARQRELPGSFIFVRLATGASRIFEKRRNHPSVVLLGPVLRVIIGPDTFGFKLSIVPGYQGAADVNLAIEKGEMHCWGGTVQAYFGSEPGRSWAKTGFVRVLVQGGQKRDARLADVPTVWELMEKHKTSEVTKGLAKVLLAPDDLGRPLLGPPGIPTDRIKVLREGFMRMMNDPDALAEARKKGLEPNPISGDEVEELVKERVQPAEVIQRMKTFLQN
jgi:tripartite-type tricarboxylate transporter receptor subunit TctC